MTKTDVSTILFTLGSVSMIVQYILIKVFEDNSVKEEGSYYKMIIKIKSKRKFIGAFIQVLFFTSLSSLLGMVSLNFLE